MTNRSQFSVEFRLQELEEAVIALYQQVQAIVQQSLANQTSDGDVEVSTNDSAE